ncbi:MAG: methyltransferase domain-containing protein, partial [Spirochaetaceae bacterium]|nr:methyltransferase domain-containing protein [Spirochaetaceae bacterium]
MNCTAPPELSRETRIRQGIFFTSPDLVQEISRQIDFSSVESVIDSAAGSGNFLVPLAQQYPHIQFYGIEKNPQVFQQAQHRCKELKNIHFFQGDVLLDTFPIPPCNVYLGNPPFINYIDLDPQYREQIKHISEMNLDLKKDFSLILGNSRADIA